MGITIRAPIRGPPNRAYAMRLDAVRLDAVRLDAVRLDAVRLRTPAKPAVCRRSEIETENLKVHQGN